VEVALHLVNRHDHAQHRRLGQTGGKRRLTGLRHIGANDLDWWRWRGV
jgi:hypothetical protein